MPPLDPIKRDLQQLNLQNNKISCVPRDYFDGFTSLKRVHLSSNLLVDFPCMTPLVSTLEQLATDANKIEMIPPNFYNTSYVRLQYLDLRSNAISIFDYGSIHAWPALRSLRLKNNRITSLPYQSLSYNNCSRSYRADCLISLQDNPIHCNNRLVSVIKLHLESRESVRLNCFMVITQPYDVYCSSPPHLCGQNLTALGKCAACDVISGLRCL